MIKFIIYSRKGATKIYEVECEKVLPIQDSSVMFLPQEESKFRILKPTLLHEKTGDGEKATFTPPIWYDFAFHSSVTEALDLAKKHIRHELTDFAVSKKKPIASEEEIEKAIADIEVIYL